MNQKKEIRSNSNFYIIALITAGKIKNQKTASCEIVKYTKSHAKIINQCTYTKLKVRMPSNETASTYEDRNREQISAVRRKITPKKSTTSTSLKDEIT